MSIQLRLHHVTTVYILVVGVHVYTCVYIIVLWLLSWCVLLSPHCILSPTVNCHDDVHNEPAPHLWGRREGRGGSSRGLSQLSQLRTIWKMVSAVMDAHVTSYADHESCSRIIHYKQCNMINCVVSVMPGGTNWVLAVTKISILTVRICFVHG